jgi:drug/metabolite transporter (DMT)-like permease
MPEGAQLGAEGGGGQGDAPGGGAPGAPTSALPGTPAAPARPSHTPSRAKLYGLLAALVAIWSINYVFAKMAVRGAPSFEVVCLRTTLSGLFMWLFAQRKGQRHPGVRPWTWRDAPRLLAVGVGGIVGNQCLFVVSLGLTSVAHGSIVSSLAPVLVLLGSSFLGHERLTRRKLLGTAVAVSGAVVLQLHRATSPGHATLLGDLVMLSSSILFAYFSIFGKRAAAEVGATAVNLFGYAGGAILLLPFPVWQAIAHPLGGLGPAAWAGVLYMSVFPSIVGYKIYAYALRWLPASRVASVNYLQPVCATLLAVAFLGERPGPAFFAGAALVLGGVWTAQRR